MNRLKWIMRLLRDSLLALIVILIPRNRRKIVFGAWSGKSFSCNPKHLFTYMCQRGGFTCVWIGEEMLRAQVEAVPGAKFARKGSLAACWHYFTAKFMVSNVNCYDDILDLPMCRRAIIIYTSHGYPDKKAETQFNGHGEERVVEVKRSWLRRVAREGLIRFRAFLYPRAAWSSASSPQGDKLRVEGQPSRLAMERMLHAGTPRADYIINNRDNAALKFELRVKYAKLLGMPTDKRWILFVPTWRHDPSYLFSFSSSRRTAAWQAFLREQNAVIIEKQHPKTVREGHVAGGRFENICVVTQEQNAQIDTQELLLASDVLITDYSSIYYDFYLMNRPVIHFTYDFQHAYEQDFGFDFDIRDYGGGPFAYTEEELQSFMAMSDDELLSRRNAKTQEQLSYETGHACEAYYRLFEQLSKSTGFFCEGLWS